MNLKNYINKFSYYFKDSYGLDRFSKYLIVGGAILSALKYTIILGYVFVVYGIWRALSKNKPRRYKELCAFEKHRNSIIQKFYLFRKSFELRGKYKIFKCPNCSQKLRVPRHTGKIIISCKKCGTEFRGKS